MLILLQAAQPLLQPVMLGMFFGILMKSMEQVIQQVLYTNAQLQIHGHGFILLIPTLIHYQSVLLILLLIQPD